MEGKRKCRFYLFLFLGYMWFNELPLFLWGVLLCEWLVVSGNI